MSGHPREETVAAEVRLAQPPRKRADALGPSAVEPAKKESAVQKAAKRAARAKVVAPEKAAPEKGPASRRRQRAGREANVAGKGRKVGQGGVQEGKGDEGDVAEGRRAAVKGEDEERRWREGGPAAKSASGKEGTGCEKALGEKTAATAKGPAPKKPARRQGRARQVRRRAQTGTAHRARARRPSHPGSASQQAQAPAHARRDRCAPQAADEPRARGHPGRRRTRVAEHPRAAGRGRRGTG